MIRNFLLIMALVAALPGTAKAATSDDRPVLRSQVMTLSEIVTIGDFYTNAGNLSSVPLFRSPDMGTSGTVPADVVANRARQAGLQDAGTDGLRSVSVHRGAVKFGRERLMTLIRSQLSSTDASLDPALLEITFFQEPGDILADPKAPDPVWVERLDWVRNSGQFTIRLAIAGETGTRQKIISGRALEMIDVVALAQPISRGDILREDDLTTVRLPRNKVPANALADASSIVGLAARTGIRPGAPLARKDFEHPILVSRGEKITVNFEMPGMKLTTRAQAMEDGAKGDIIDVMNLQSRRIVPATVTSRGQVRVNAAHPVVASLTNGAN